MPTNRILYLFCQRSIIIAYAMIILPVFYEVIPSSGHLILFNEKHFPCHCKSGCGKPVEIYTGRIIASIE